MERLPATLCDAGVPRDSAPVAADMLLSHVTGFTLPEQTAAVSTADADTIAELARRFPMTIEHGTAHDADEMFVRSVHLLCAGIETLLPT